MSDNFYKEKQLRSSKYLYNIEPCHFANLTYKGALKKKLKSGKLLLRELNEIAFSLSGSDYINNEIRLLKVSDAIDFNRNLLDEIKECK